MKNIAHVDTNLTNGGRRQARGRHQEERKRQRRRPRREGITSARRMRRETGTRRNPEIPTATVGAHTKIDGTCNKHEGFLLIKLNSRDLKEQDATKAGSLLTHRYGNTGGGLERKQSRLIIKRFTLSFKGWPDL